MRLVPGTRISSLSIHADYVCRHSGACCTARWPIPVERATLERLSEAISSGRLVVPATDAAADPSEPFIEPGDAPEDTPAIAATRDDGACTFYEAQTGLCAIHRQVGAGLLPVACQQFPRVSLLDGRGLFVTLSHYCPTAAALLFRGDVALRVVDGPRSLPADFPYDPLDARHVLPPLLKPDVLLDLDTFDRWERTIIAILARDDVAAEDALLTAAQFTENLRTWRPGDHALASHFDATTARLTAPGAPHHSSTTTPVEIEPLGRGTGETLCRHYAMALATIPPGFRPEPLGSLERELRELVEPRWPTFSVPVRRYLAARMFGSWLAYQGRGLRTIVFSAAVALSVLKANAARACAAAGMPLDRATLMTAIRRTDEMLLHLASREALARELSVVEACP